jgi:hypothetical protein
VPARAGRLVHVASRNAVMIKRLLTIILRIVDFVVKLELEESSISATFETF